MSKLNEVANRLGDAPLLRVLMTTNLYPPVVSGSSLHIEELARQLARRGHQVAIVTTLIEKGLPRHVRTPEGVEIYRVPCVRLPRHRIALGFEWLNTTMLPGTRREIRRIVREFRPDVIHVHNHIFDTALHAASIARSEGVPAVLSLHTPVQHDRAGYERILRFAERAVLRPRVIDAMSVIVCPDQNIVRYVADRFGPRATALVPYGVHEPAPATAAHRAALQEEFGLVGRRVVLSIGHVHAIRSRLDLIAAMPEVVRRIPEVLLLIVGGEFDLAPRAAVQSLGLERHVRFAGARPHADVRALLEIAEVEAHWFTVANPKVRPSPGIATAEAMLAGVPAMTATPEDVYGEGVLRDQDNIVLVRAGDRDDIASRLANLLEDNLARTRIGHAGRTLVRQHMSWDAVVPKMVEVYRSAVRGPTSKTLRSADPNPSAEASSRTTESTSPSLMPANSGSESTLS